jgi:hypothetical protein
MVFDPEDCAWMFEASEGVGAGREWKGWRWRSGIWWDGACDEVWRVGCVEGGLVAGA